ncbi:MAG: NYN domain-containing protein, partial [Pseudomonadota bacterium]
VSSRHVTRVLGEGRKLGRLDVARVYVTAKQPSDWLPVPGFRPIYAGAAKNAADVLLSIDAMELALVGGIDCFVIVTSDRDYAHLALRLRERGLVVLGLGEAKATAEFRLACTAFVLLPGDAPSVSQAARQHGVSELDRRIRCMIATHSRSGGGMRLADLSPKMHAAHGTRISTFPERTWRAYLAARPALYEIDPRGPEAMVRFRPSGFAPH